MFFVFKNYFNRDLYALLKILIFLSLIILIFRFIIFESNLFLNIISNLNIKILMLIDRMIISRYLNLNTLIVITLPLSMLFYFASIEKHVVARFFLNFYFFIFSISILFNSLIISEFLPIIRLEKVIQNFLIYITFPIVCIYILLKSKIDRIVLNKKLVDKLYYIVLTFFFIINLVYFPIAKSVTNKEFFSKVNSDFKKIAFKKNNEIITSSFIHGYIDVMYLSKSPIVVPMFSITKIDNRDINIYCENEINKPFIESNDYFSFVEDCFKKEERGMAHV